MAQMTQKQKNAKRTYALGAQSAGESDLIEVNLT